MSLFRWELTKIWRRRSTKISLFILVAYAVLSTVYNAVFNLASDFEKADGIAEIARQYEFADSFRGELTEEKLTFAYHNLLTAYSEENLVPNEYDDTLNPSQEVWDKYVVPLGTMQNVLRNTYMCLPEYSYFNSITDVPEEMIKDFYSIRDEIAEKQIYSKVTDEKDRAFFLSQNEKASKPFYYDWYEGQEIFMLTISVVTVIAAFVCIIFTAPIFAAEYSERTAPMIMSARHGRKKIACAKLGAVLIFSCITYALGVGVFLCGQLYFLGTRGLDCPIQLIYPNRTVPLTIWGAEMYQIILGFLGCIAMTLITAFVSSVVNSSFPAVAIPSAVMILSGFMGGNIPEALSFISVIIPFMSDYHELFHVNMYFHVWSPYIILISPVVISAVFLPFASYKYIRHQVA
ncbi:MAG: ABC transporter permease [Oscillospiraceae bacterium]